MENPPHVERQSKASAVDKHLEDVAWGLLLVLTGFLWIVPGVPLPFGTWLIGVGIILVGANVVRYSTDRRFETFSVVLGIVALVAGLGEFLAVNLSLIGLALLAFGVVLLVKPLRQRRADRRVAA